MNDDPSNVSGHADKFPPNVVTLADAASRSQGARRGHPNTDPRREPYGDGHFSVNDRGVYFEGAGEEAQWICSPLRIVAKTRDANNGDWGRLVVWRDDDGVEHRWAMPMAMVEGDGADVRRELARLGVQIATTRSARELLLAFLKVWSVRARARCVDRLGWHGGVFTIPTGTIGVAAEQVVFQNTHAITPAFAVAGSVTTWRDNVGALATGNTRLTFAIAAAFAGTLVDIAGEGSGGFHFRGVSSSGKSTALCAAASVWGPPREYVRTWRTTVNGLEGLAALHNDGLLILDELGQVDPAEAGQAAYLIANGQGKTRASRDGTARASLRWRLIFMSAGEESLTAVMAKAGLKTNAGQEVRLADIGADAGAGRGLFERLHRQMTPAVFAQAVKDAAELHYGAVGVAWLQRVVERRAELIDTVNAEARAFVNAHAAAASGQCQRVARRFALVGIAGELATEWGLTGWVSGEAPRAASACFRSWLEAFGHGDREELHLLSRVRSFFELHGSSRFEELDAARARAVHNRAGFVRIRNGVREYLVLPEVFRRELCGVIDPPRAAAILGARGVIAPGGDGRPTQKLRLHREGAPSRAYVFTPKLWEAES